MDTTIMNGQNHICKKCGNEFGKESGKYYFNDIVDAGFYCTTCLSKIAAMQLGAKMRSHREYFSNIPWIKGTTKNN